MHAHRPGAVLGGERGGGDRGGVAPVDRPGMAGRDRRAGGRGTTCGWCRPAAGGRARAAGRARRAAPSCARPFLAKPMPGSRISASAAMPAASAAARRCCSSSHTSATTSVYRARACMSKLGPRPCISTYGTRRSATSANISGSLPPVTSLTRHAPASSAAAATSARLVSTLTSAPAAASSLTTGRMRRSSSCGRDASRARPGRLAADVDQVGAGGEHGDARAAGLPRIGVHTAVGERIGRDVDDAHHQRATGRRDAQHAGRHGGTVTSAVLRPGYGVRLDDGSTARAARRMLGFGHTMNASASSIAIAIRGRSRPFG